MVTKTQGNNTKDMKQVWCIAISCYFFTIWTILTFYFLPMPNAQLLCAVDCQTQFGSVLGVQLSGRHQSTTRQEVQDHGRCGLSAYTPHLGSFGGILCRCHSSTVAFNGCFKFGLHFLLRLNSFLTMYLLMTANFNCHDINCSYFFHFHISHFSLLPIFIRFAGGGGVGCSRHVLISPYIYAIGAGRLSCTSRNFQSSLPVLPISPWSVCITIDINARVL